MDAGYSAARGFLGHEVAFCTVDRIMRELGLHGVVRGRAPRTTVRAKDSVWAGDQLNRDFTADAPNLAWVADFTCVATGTGWTHVAFVFDVYSRSTVGWTASTSKTTALVSKALNMAAWNRDELDAVAAALNGRPRKTLGW